MAFHHGTSTKVVSRLWLCKLWNFFGCIAALYFFAYVAKSSQSPLTIDVFIKIFLAELNRFINGRRRQGGQVSGQKPRKNKGIEKQPLRLEPVPIATPQCMAAIVGYREDPGIFKKALESYNDARSCSFVMVGVDGDALEDQEMVDVFLQVCDHLFQGTQSSLDNSLREIRSTLIDRPSYTSMFPLPRQLFNLMTTSIPKRLNGLLTRPRTVAMLPSLGPAAELLEKPWKTTR